MKTLYFIRHGESEFNKANKWAGSSDTPLTTKGHKQAKQAGHNAKKQGLVFDVIVSSPLERAHETAKHVASGVGFEHRQIVVDKKLIERDFGELEGKKDLVASTKYYLDESGIDSYKGVESMADLQQRAEQVLAWLHSLPHDTILVVAHGGFGRALRRAIKKESIKNRGQKIDNAELIRLI